MFSIGQKKYNFLIGFRWLYFLLTFLFLFGFVVQAAAPPEKHDLKYDSRIERQLAELSLTARKHGIEAAASKAGPSRVELAEGNSMDVVIEMESGQSLNRAALGRLNGKVLRRADSIYEVRVPLSEIIDLTKEVDGIKFVRRPYVSRALGVEYGAYLTDGVNLTGGGLFHSKNLLGQGVKIAVIDVGFASFKYAEEAGEFPPGSIADKEDYTGNGIFTGSSHGTTVAAIVHDMAPSAKLYLKKIDTGVSLENAVSDAISQGIDIVVHSVGWVNTNFGDGTGFIADQTKKAMENGILWVNAAGNSAKRHWEGVARDGDGDGWVEFAENDETLKVKVDYDSTIQAFLTWNDWPESNKDFDFFLYDEDGIRLSSSQNYQTGSEPPAESLSYSATPSGTYNLKISVPDNYEGTDLEIFSFNHWLIPGVADSSIMAPGNVGEVLTVGAINKRNWKDGPIEYFSSQGPTADGRTKPDITAVDGVTTFLRGSFLGTSAAAPYAAGAAALILSRAPDASSAEIKEALYKDAQDLGEPGDDNVYGKGKMRLIYKNPSASRNITPPGDGEIEPGDTFTVTLNASMPLTLQGGLEIAEKVPDPFKISNVKKPDTAEKTGQGTINCRWKIVEPGTEKEIEYEVLVPGDTPPGDYEFSGTINGNSVEGTSTAAVNVAPQNEDRAVIEEVKAIWNSFTKEVEYGVEGENVSEIRVKVYSLNGKQVFNSGWREGTDFQWNLHDSDNDTVPNGVYISLVEIKGPGGEIEASELNKTLVLR